MQIISLISVLAVVVGSLAAPQEASNHRDHAIFESIYGMKL